MCIDFTNLNKYCLKDYCPLPSIEQKVTANMGCEGLSFLDLYKGYHKVMDPADVEKTTFVTDWRVFSYKKMPFGFKNAGATDQCLVDHVFTCQIGWNIEVYMDDILLS